MWHVIASMNIYTCLALLCYGNSFDGNIQMRTKHTNCNDVWSDTYYGGGTCKRDAHMLCSFRFSTVISICLVRSNEIGKKSVAFWLVSVGAPNEWMNFATITNRTEVGCASTTLEIKKDDFSRISVFISKKVLWYWKVPKIYHQNYNFFFA